jgi:hypothetical protein
MFWKHYTCECSCEWDEESESLSNEPCLECGRLVEPDDYEEIQPRHQSEMGVC